MSDAPEPGQAPAEGGGPLEAGTVVAGKYEIERLLGQGAIGTVYLAKHPRLDLPLAVKMLKSSVARDRQSVERFERGARNLSRVNHPHVCRLYDFGETEDGQLFLVLEYVEGESLSDLIARVGPMAPQRACTILLHICRALHAAHEAGIVHRDLKPGNVMIGRSASGQEVAKVVDFDIAKRAEPDIPGEVTQVGYVIGTPEYMSPEQLTGEELDGRSDLYSAGTILYRCLTGALPFDKPSTREIMLARLTEEPVPLAQHALPFALPPGLAALVTRALARDREARWQNAADMAKALAAFTDGGYETRPSAPALGGESTVAVPATQVAPAASAAQTTPRTDGPPAAKAGSARNRRLWIGGAAAAGLAFAAFGGWRAWGPTPAAVADGGGSVQIDEPIALDSTGPEGEDSVVDSGTAPVPDPDPPPVDRNPEAQAALAALNDRVGLLPGAAELADIQRSALQYVGAEWNAVTRAAAACVIAQVHGSRDTDVSTSQDQVYSLGDSTRRWAQTAVDLHPGGQPICEVLLESGGLDD